MDRINDVFQEVFGDDELKVDRVTTADDVEGWDSVMQVTLMVHVEKAFGVKFTTFEVARLKNVGELADLVEQMRLAKHLAPIIDAPACRLRATRRRAARGRPLDMTPSFPPPVRSSRRLASSLVPLLWH